VRLAIFKVVMNYLASVISSDDLVLLYMSGHGGKAILPPARPFAGLLPLSPQTNETHLSTIMLEGPQATAVTFKQELEPLQSQCHLFRSLCLQHPLNHRSPHSSHTRLSKPNLKIIVRGESGSEPGAIAWPRNLMRTSVSIQFACPLTFPKHECTQTPAMPAATSTW